MYLDFNCRYATLIIGIIPKKIFQNHGKRITISCTQLIYNKSYHYGKFEVDSTMIIRLN